MWPDGCRRNEVGDVGRKVPGSRTAISSARRPSARSHEGGPCVCNKSICEAAHSLVIFVRTCLGLTPSLDNPVASNPSPYPTKSL